VWLELAAEHPRSFVFDHSCGLGVIAVGDNVPWAVTPLFTLDENDASAVRDRFRKLGAKLMKRIDSRENRERVKNLPTLPASDLLPSPASR
jgi:hypothetical protein